MVLTIDFISLDKTYKEKDINGKGYTTYTCSLGNFQTILARVRYIVE